MTAAFNFIFPKNALRINNEPCGKCNQCALYELDLEDEDMLANKIFCLACNVCTECEEVKSTPDNVCSACYCPKCSHDYYFLIEHMDNMNTNMKWDYKMMHIYNCNGRIKPVQDITDMFNSVSMDTN